MKKLFVLLLLSQAAFGGDWFALGIRGGVPLTDAIKNVSSGDFHLRSATKSFTIGPSAELLLPFGFGIEVDALHKSTDLRMTAQNGVPPNPVAISNSVGSWEFPLLAKFRLPGDALRPYIAGGVAFRRFGDLVNFATGLDRTTSGFVLGGGLEIKVGWVRISPEIRYTRWGSGRTAASPDDVRYNQNEADFLLGFTF